MSERSYGQYCPIAHALDLVGDRWALLIVRDLFLGPKRYSDLRDALPGTGSNILAARLKALEGAGIVARRALPPPAASTVYELTPNGRGLEGVITALGHWGERSLGARRPDQIVSAESLMLAGRALFTSLTPALGMVRAELRIADAAFDGAFGVRIDGGSVVDVTRAPAPAPAPPPDLTVRTDVETLYAMAAGRITLSDAVAAGLVDLKGAPEVVAAVGRRAASPADAAV